MAVEEKEAEATMARVMAMEMEMAMARMVKMVDEAMLTAAEEVEAMVMEMEMKMAEAMAAMGMMRYEIIYTPALYQYSSLVQSLLQYCSCIVYFLNDLVLLHVSLFNFVFNLHNF